MIIRSSKALKKQSSLIIEEPAIVEEVKKVVTKDTTNYKKKNKKNISVAPAVTEDNVSVIQEEEAVDLSEWLKKEENIEE